MKTPTTLALAPKEATEPRTVERVHAFHPWGSIERNVRADQDLDVMLAARRQVYAVVCSELFDIHGQRVPNRLIGDRKQWRE